MKLPRDISGQELAKQLAEFDDSSFDEILRELAFSRMIERGLDDARQNRVISNEEMQQRIKAWQQ